MTGRCFGGKFQNVLIRRQLLGDEPAAASLPATSPSSSDGIKATAAVEGEAAAKEEEERRRRPPKRQTPTSKGGNRNDTGRPKYSNSDKV